MIEQERWNKRSNKVLLMPLITKSQVLKKPAAFIKPMLQCLILMHPLQDCIAEVIRCYPELPDMLTCTVLDSFVLVVTAGVMQQKTFVVFDARKVASQCPSQGIR